MMKRLTGYGSDDNGIGQRSAVSGQRSIPAIGPRHPATGLLILLFLLFIFPVLIQGQHVITQTIRGTVVDKISQSPLPGANVVLMNTDPLVGVSTDLSGQFLLKDVLVGRQSIRVSFMGYRTVTFENLMVTSGKELVIHVELEENVVTEHEVEIVAEQRKDQPINPMAVISARSFTIEETSRYAGSYGDPARMAANYAGVVSVRDNRNDIIIRGNSPLGLQYRIDGMEVPNPNHFAASGTTGGPITILNSNLLANSDFITGAFPAEYGNALGGIFDIHLRSGNEQQHEYWAELGFNGLEFGLEGPFSRSHTSSYIASYRYSFTAFLEALGIKLNESADYQDLSFKFHIPTAKAGTFSITGLGGTGEIKEYDSQKDQQDWTFPTHGENLRNRTSLLAIGISHLYFFDPSLRFQTQLYFTRSQVENKIDTFSVTAPDLFTWAGEKSIESKLSGSMELRKKFSAKDNLNSGLFYDLYHVNYADSQYYHGVYRVDTEAERWMSLFRGFAEYQHRFGPSVTASFGLHYEYLTLNGSNTLEPRIGLKWDINPVHALSAGFGLHSQMQPGFTYFTQNILPPDTIYYSNLALDFTRSRHYVVGYDYLITEHLRFKAEAYYQDLYDVPVKQSIPQYSILNEGVDYFIQRQDSLVNMGKGTNYGLELTLERFLFKNYYFLITASLYRSLYKGYDGIERSTAFDNIYVFNAVGGYELPIGKMKNKFLIFGLKATYAGGRPYLPYDEEATVQQGEVVFDWANAYEIRFDDYFRASLRLGFRRNIKKANMMLLFDLQYRSNYTYVYLYRIDVVTGDVTQSFKMGFYPMATWRIQF